MRDGRSGQGRPRRRLGALAAACGGLLLSLAVASGASGALHVRLVSRNSQGQAANGDSTTEGAGGAVSGDGKLIAFVSKAANLPQGDGSTYEAYVRNATSGTTRLASTDAGGNPATGYVFGAAISASGRFVVFYGPGDGLPGADPPHYEVWIHDMKTGKTRLASKAKDGSPGDGFSEYPSVSATGRFVAFESSAANLPAGDGSTIFAYVRDLKKGKTILVSKTSGGDPVQGRMYGHSVTADGRDAIFGSSDPGLPGGDGSTRHIYERNLASGKTLLMDRTRSGHAGNGDAYDASVTDNGRFLAYDSYATNLPGGNGYDQVFLRNMKTGRSALISRKANGHAANGNSYYAHASEDGHNVAFESYAPDLPGGDGSTQQIYERRMRSKRTVLLSRAANGDPADAYAEYPSLSGDGDWAAFYSGATNLGGNVAYTNVFRAGPLG